MKTSHSLLLILMIFSGCTTGGVQLPPDASPIPVIVSTWQQLVSSGIPPSALLNIGMVLDDQGCYHWFDQQVQGSQGNALAGSVLGLGTAAAAGVGAPIAVPLGLGLLSSLNGSLQANSPTGVNTVADYGLTLRQRQAYQSALAAMPPPLTPDVAFVYLNAYHQYCTLSGIQYAAAQAKMSAPVTVIPAPTPTPIPVPPPPVMPPTTVPPPPVISQPPITVPPPSGTNPPVTPNFRPSVSPYYYPGPNPYGGMAIPPRIRVGY